MVDARGLSCPQPVIMVKQEMERTKEEKYEVLVDSMVCVENISRYANSVGFQADYEKENGEFRMTLKKQ